MKNSTYWKKRFEALEDEQYRQSAGFTEALQKKFDAADRELEKSLRLWYGRFGANEGVVTYADAKKLLKSAELEEFQWDVEQYAAYARKHGLDPEWITKLENASARVHVSRYESIQLQMRQVEEKLYAQYNKECYGYLGDLVKDSFYHTAYEIEKGTGIGVDLHRIDKDALEKYLTHPWCQDGKVFSDRIWQRKDEMIRTLDQELTKQLITGADPQKAIDAISDKFQVGKRQAGTLVMTESAALASEASRDSMKELGVEEYEILATLDSHTSDICREMDGKHFRMSEYEPGTTAPPFHPNCRSTTVPYFNDEFTADETRAARDAADEGYERVPADMKYEEWRRKYVLPNAKDPENMDDITSSFDMGKSSGIEKIGRANSIKVKGKTYHIDGTNVDFRVQDREEEVAKIITKKYGGELKHVPEVKGIYKGVRTPDFLWNGEKWDLKEIIEASSDNTIRNIAHKCKDQAENLIFDITKSKHLTFADVRDQVKKLKIYDNCSHISKVMIIKEDKILKVYQR